MKSIVDFRQVKFTILLDGQAIKLKAKEVMIANGGLFGLEGLSENPEVILDDGLLDIFSLRGDTLFDYLRTGLGFLIGKRGRKINVHHWKCNEVTISTNKPVIVQSDGEVIGRTPVSVKVEPKVISVIVPSPTEKKSLDQLIVTVTKVHRKSCKKREFQSVL
jgi:diacylglycerol kinase family enzyme